MTKHDIISPGLGLPEKGFESKYSAGFCALQGEPSGWERDQLGQVRWLAELARTPYGPWVHVVTQEVLDARGADFNAVVGGVPVQMPSLSAYVRRERGEVEAFSELRKILKLPDSPEKAMKLRRLDGRGPGRPSRTRTAPGEIRAAAWLSDSCHFSALQIAELMGLGGDDDRSTRRTVQDYVVDGRRFLNDVGALPWTLWVDGVVPKRWWETEEFALGVGIWLQQIDSQREKFEALLNWHAAGVTYMRLIDRPSPS